MTDDIRKLLGGYATGTLTDAEQQLLYEAALDDEKLFDALANEQALKELLDDPASRAQLLQAVETPRFSVRNALWEWFGRPRAKATVATGVVLMVAIAVTQVRNRPDRSVARNNESREAVTLSAPVPPPETGKPQQYARSAPKKETAAATQPRAYSATAGKAKDAVIERPSEPVMTAAAPISIREEQQAPPEEFAQIAKAGAIELRYVLRKRAASGDFTAVPVTSLLAESDEARLTVQVNERGVVLLTSDKGDTPSSALVEPGRAFTLAIPQGSRTIALSFRHPPRQLLGNTLTPSAAVPAEREARAKANTPGPAVQLEDSARLMKAEDSSAPLISVEIKLNRN
jgi:hypothetical protein